MYTECTLVYSKAEWISEHPVFQEHEKEQVQELGKEQEAHFARFEVLVTVFLRIQVSLHMTLWRWANCSQRLKRRLFRNVWKHSPKNRAQN